MARGCRPRRLLTLLVAVAMLLAACSGTGGGASTEQSASENGAPSDDGSGGAGSSGNVVSPQPPGSGYAMVDGLEYTFDTPGGISCTVTDDEFAFSHIIGDNEIVLGGGASISGGQWFGSVTLRVFADNGVTEYSAKIVDNPSGIAVDGNSVSYSGPMEKRAPSNDGSPSEPEDVGNGTFSATC